MPVMSDSIQVSNHARARAQQRGISPATIDTILAFADRRVPIGGGLQSQFVSRARLQSLSGIAVPPVDCERADGVVLVVDRAENIVVSVVRPEGRRGRRYYKPLSSHKRARAVAVAREADHA